MIAGCEACSEDAEIPFDNILDRLTGSDPSVTDYVLETPARCLQCGAEINEKSLSRANLNSAVLAREQRQKALFCVKLKAIVVGILNLCLGAQIRR